MADDSETEKTTAPGSADLAPGTGHFRTTIAEGQALMRELRGAVSGLCQPTYVLDIPGGHGKAPVGPCYVEGGEVTDPSGARHAYPPALLRQGDSATVTARDPVDMGSR